MNNERKRLQSTSVVELCQVGGSSERPMNISACMRSYIYTRVYVYMLVCWYGGIGLPFLSLSLLNLICVHIQCYIYLCVHGSTKVCIIYE